MHVEAGMPLQPFVDQRVFVGGVIVGNDMNVQLRRALLVDLFEKGQPLLMTVARRKAGDQFAFEIIERGEQAQCAVANVIMGLDWSLDRWRLCPLWSSKSRHRATTGAIFPRISAPAERRLDR
jgi:hypothetical protein